MRKLIIYYTLLGINLLISDSLLAGDKLETHVNTEHVVQTGETIYGIALKYQVTVESIMHTNSSLNSSYTIRPGQVIKIPDENTVTLVRMKQLECEILKCKYHIVQPYETLQAIAYKYHIQDISTLKSMNKLSSEVISPGQELLVQILEKKPIAVTEVKKMNNIWQKANARREIQKSNLLVAE